MLKGLTAMLLAAVATTPSVGVVHRGQLVHLTMHGPYSSRGACAAYVVYADGFMQQTGVRFLAYGRVTFAIRVPKNAGFGPASWTVHCGLTLERSGTWHVRPRS